MANALRHGLFNSSLVMGHLLLTILAVRGSDVTYHPGKSARDPQATGFDTPVCSVGCRYMNRVTSGQVLVCRIMAWKRLTSTA